MREEYDLFDLYSELKITEQLPEKPPYAPPSTPLSEGQRHNEINSFLGHIINDEGIAHLVANSPGTSEDALLTNVIGHIYLHRHLWPNHADFLPPSGKRFPEVKAQVRAYFVKALSQKAGLNGHSAPTPLVTQSPQLSYDPALFLQAPGLIGRLAKDFNAIAPISIPQFDYAAARTLIGFLKSFTDVTDTRKVLPPTDYLMCLAPTGAGKSGSKNLLQDLLVKLGFASHLTHKVRSTQGLDRLLDINRERLILLHNEAHHFLIAARSSTNDYMKSFFPWLLELYDTYNQSIATTGATGDEKAKVYDHAYAQLGYLGFGVPIELDRLFNAESLNEGTMPRFLVLTANPPANDSLPLDYFGQTPEPSEIPSFSILKDLAERTGESFRKEKDEIVALINSVTELESEIKDLPFDERKHKTDQLREAKRKRDEATINARKSERLVPKVRVPYSNEAKAEMQLIYKEICKRQSTSEAMNGFYSRTFEHVGRAALCDADNGVIELKHVQFAYESIMAISKDLEIKVSKNLNEGSLGVLLNRIIELVKIEHAKGDLVVSKSIIKRQLSHLQQVSFEQAIAMGEELGEIAITPTFERRGKILKKGLTVIKDAG